MPSTSPVSSSTSWAKARAGFVPVAAAPVAGMPEYVRRSFGAPIARASTVPGSILTSTAVAALAGVMFTTEDDNRSVVPFRGVAGPDTLAALRASVPSPWTVTGASVPPG